MPPKDRFRSKGKVRKSFMHVLAIHAQHLCHQTYSEWKNDKVPRLGAALAFYSILSLAPMLLLALSAATFLWGHDAAKGQITGQITNIFGAHAAHALNDVLTVTSDEQHTDFIASCISFFMLLFSASGMFGELQAAMNIIWKVKPSSARPIRTMIKERMFSFIMVIVSGALLLVSLLASTALAAATSYINDLLPEARLLMKASDFSASFIIITLLFSITFKVVPERPVPWKSVWVGASLTAILFVAGKTIIGLYLGHVGIASTYGAAGSLIILLLWIYYSAQIFFLGAEFTYVYGRHFKLYKNSSE